MFTVDCVVPFVTELVEIEDTEPFLDGDIRLIELDPQMAFISEKDIEVFVTVTPILDVD